MDNYLRIAKDTNILMELEEINKSLKQFEELFHIPSQEFYEQWKKNSLPDTFENNFWAILYEATLKERIMDNLDIDNKEKWWKRIGNDFIEPRNKTEFEKEYLVEFPKPTMLDNFENFTNRLLKVPYPKHDRSNECDSDFIKRISAYEKQIEIAGELLKLVKYYRYKENNEK